MTIKELFKLSHRELIAYRTRSWATVIAIGVLFGLLLAVIVIVQGLENAALRYAGNATNGVIYLVSSYKNNSVVLERIGEFGGEIIALADDQKAGLNEEILSAAIVARFSSLSRAYEYYSKSDAKQLHYSSENYQIVELFGNQISVYRYFCEKNKDFIRPITIALMIVSVFILAFTMAHLITSSTKTFVLYRSIGASKSQLLLIYFGYLLELCIRAAGFAILLALILAGVATTVGWNYLSDQFTTTFPDSPAYWPVLIGANWRCVWVIIGMFSVTPISFLLCLDQFSNRKLAQKLKGD